MPVTRLDLNCDIGESYGAYEIGADAALLEIATSANIACGFHAGDPDVMARAVAAASAASAASAAGAAIGAHPGLPERQGFGRRAMTLSPSEAYNTIVYQVGALAAFARLHGHDLRHVKPHGALYHMAEADGAIAEAIAMAARDLGPGLILIALAGGRLAQCGRRLGIRVASEIFADRAYEPDGSLSARTEPDAVIHDPATAANRIAQWAKTGKMTTRRGAKIELIADTVCVHGDTPEAVAIARAVRTALESAGIAVLRPDAPS